MAIYEYTDPESGHTYRASDEVYGDAKNYMSAVGATDIADITEPSTASVSGGTASVGIPGLPGGPGAGGPSSPAAKTVTPRKGSTLPKAPVITDYQTTTQVQQDKGIKKPDIYKSPDRPGPATGDVTKRPFELPVGSALRALEAEIRDEFKSNFGYREMYAESYKEARFQIRNLTNYLPGIREHGGNEFFGPGYSFNGMPLADAKVAEAALEKYSKDFDSLDALIGAAKFRDALVTDANLLIDRYNALRDEEFTAQQTQIENERQAEIDASLLDYEAQLADYYRVMASAELSPADKQRLQAEHQTSLALAQQQAAGQIAAIQEQTQGSLSTARLEHQSRAALQEQEYDLRFQIQQIEQAFAGQQAALDRALQAEDLIEVRRSNQVMEALQAQKNELQAKENQLGVYSLIADSPEMLFFAGQSGILEGLGDVMGDGGEAIQNIMNSINKMPAMDNLQQFSRLSGLEQGIEGMRLGALRGVSESDIPQFLRGQAPRAILNPQDPNAAIGPGAGPLFGADYQSLLSQYTGQPGMNMALGPDESFISTGPGTPDIIDRNIFQGDFTGATTKSMWPPGQGPTYNPATSNVTGFPDRVNPNQNINPDFYNELAKGNVTLPAQADPNATPYTGDMTKVPAQLNLNQLTDFPVSAELKKAGVKPLSEGVLVSQADVARERQRLENTLGVSIGSLTSEQFTQFMLSLPKYTISQPGSNVWIFRGYYPSEIK
jgi:hypothetical protein